MASTNRKTIVAGALVVGAIVAGAGAFLIREKVSEQPSFTVTHSEGDFEIRDYAPMLVAETWVEGPREAALNRGFGVLAAYIFAKSRGGAPIAMTAPVMSDRQEDRGWRTRFVMPAKYTRDTLPPPPAGVTIAEVPRRRVAAVRFSGRATDASLASHEQALRAWLAANNERAAGPVDYAFYNSPFIPGPLRRNEVLITLD